MNKTALKAKAKAKDKNKVIDKAKKVEAKRTLKRNEKNSGSKKFFNIKLRVGA